MFSSLKIKQKNEDLNGLTADNWSSLRLTGVQKGSTWFSEVNIFFSEIK